MKHSIKVLAGDFSKGEWNFFYEKSIFNNGAKLKLNNGFLQGYSEFKFSELKIERVGGNQSKQIGRSIGGSAIGGLLLGGAGLVAGALMGGNAGKVQFSVTTKTGKRALCEVSNKLWVLILAAAF